jgi:hypothetical protein
MDESGIVTSINTLPGNESESMDLPELLEKERIKGIEGNAVTAGALYNSTKNREFTHRMGLKVYIPPRIRERDNEGFVYDPNKISLPVPMEISQLRENVGKRMTHFSN